MRAQRWRSSFLSVPSPSQEQDDASVVAKIIPSYHPVDPDTELAPWFLGGLTGEEIELTVLNMLQKGHLGSFIVCDLTVLSPRAVYMLKCLNKEIIEEFVIEKAPSPAGYRIRGMQVAGTKDETWPTIHSMIRALSSEVRSPLAVKLRPDVSGGAFMEAVRRRSSYRRSQSRKNRGDSPTSPDSAGDTPSSPTSSSPVELGAEEEAFGFGDLFGSGDDEAITKLEALDNLVNLRNTLRTEAEALERKEEQKRMRDPFWEEAEAERLRKLEYARRNLTDAELKELEAREAQEAFERDRRANEELKEQEKRLKMAKRASIMAMNNKEIKSETTKASGQLDDVDVLLSSMLKAGATIHQHDDNNLGISSKVAGSELDSMKAAYDMSLQWSDDGPDQIQHSSGQTWSEEIVGVPIVEEEVPVANPVGRNRFTSRQKAKPQSPTSPSRSPQRSRFKLFGSS